MGGDPTGGVSIAALMIQLCKWRHQDGRISMHSKNLRTVYLTPDHNDGPVAWEMRPGALPNDFPNILELCAIAVSKGLGRDAWFELARETWTDVEGVYALEPLTSLQAATLRELARMEV
jgi:hypothetical protein